MTTDASTPTPTPPTPTPVASGPGHRAADLVLAGLHLRLGSLALARASLETMAGRDALDDDGLVDLAEVRWRTGDVAGAGQAAMALLGDGDEGPVVGLVVAAEAAMARGRPTEARRFARRAMAQAGDGLDATFAGMPRAAIWPADPLAAAPTVAPMFDVPAVGPARDRAPEPVRDDVDDVAAAAPDIDPIGLWDVLNDAPGTDPHGPADADPDADGDLPAIPDLPEPEDELDRGRDALRAGDTAAAALHFGMVLRVRPTLAPAVLDLVADDRSPTLAFVRGDAYRLVGRELDARRAFIDAVRHPDPVPDPVPGPEPEPDAEPDAEPEPEPDPADRSTEGDPA